MRKSAESATLSPTGASYFSDVMTDAPENLRRPEVVDSGPYTKAPPVVEPSMASSCLACVEENIPDRDRVAPRRPGMKFLSFWPKWVTSAVSADRENVTELTPDE